MIGRVDGCYRDYKRDVWVVQIATHDMPKAIDSLKDSLLDIVLKKHREKRSISANAAYWALLPKLAKALCISNAHCHNLMLRRYGVAIPDMMVCIPDTDEKARETDEKETYHLMPTSALNGELRVYLMLKGSHEMNTEEFSRLLNGLIDECNDQGIETLSPNDMERLKYEINNANRA